MEIPYHTSNKTENLIDWRKLPALRLLFSLIPFIIIGYYIHVETWVFLIVLLIFGIGSALLFYYNRIKSAYLIAAAIIGLYIGYCSGSSFIESPDVMIQPLVGRFQGRIENITKSDSVSLRLVCKGTLDCKELKPIQNVRILVTLMKPNNRVKHCIPGALISVTGKAQIPRKAYLPTDFDERTYCKGLEALCLFSAFSDNCALLEESESWRLYIHTITANIRERIAEIFPSVSKGIMIALLLGDKTYISPETKAQYSIAGTAHVLAVSGLHITIISLIILLPLGFVQNRLLKLIMFTVILTLFVVLTGLEPSAIRSALMSVLVLTAYTFQRKPVLLNILALTVIIILIIQPSMIFSIGFQLSVFAVFGITLLYKRILELIIITVNKWGINNTIIHYLYESLAITLSASVFVSLITCIYFQTFSIISPVVNMLIVPLSSIAMVFGFIAVIISYLSFGLAELYALSASLLITLSVTINANAAAIPYAAIKGNNAIIFALFNMASLLYISFSTNRRNTIFRISVCGVCMGMVILLKEQYTIADPITIVPRQNIVMACIHLNSDTSFIMLADRKAHIEPKDDKALVQYLEQLPHHLIIGKLGNCSEWISVQVFQKRKTDIIPVSNSLYKKMMMELHQPNFHTLIHEQ